MVVFLASWGDERRRLSFDTSLEDITKKESRNRQEKKASLLFHFLLDYLLFSPHPLVLIRLAFRRMTSNSSIHVVRGNYETDMTWHVFAHSDRDFVLGVVFFFLQSSLFSSYSLQGGSAFVRKGESRFTPFGPS